MRKRVGTRTIACSLRQSNDLAVADHDDAVPHLELWFTCGTLNVPFAVTIFMPKEVRGRMPSVAVLF